MSISVSDIVFLSYSLVAYVGVFTCLAVYFYYAYLRMDELLGYLKNCPAVLVRKAFIDSGPMGRLFVLGGVINVLRQPEIFFKDGGADPIDLKAFPEDIKRKLLRLHRFSCFFVVMLMGLFIALKLGVF